ncbi:MAG: diguanylate cyclase [Candidatus Firestonebacteria bacterium]
MRERRKFRRIRQAVTVKILPFSNPSQIIEGKVLDISAGGIGVCAKNTLQKGDSIKLTFEISEELKFIEVQGVIHRVDTSGNDFLAIKFVNLNKKDVRRIVEFIDKNHEKKDALFTNLLSVSAFYILCFFVIFSLVPNINFLTFVLIFLIGFVFYRVDILNHRLIRKLTTTNRQLHYVDQLTQALRRSMKVGEMLDLVLKNLTDELGYDRVIIYSVENTGHKHDILRAITTFGVSLEKVSGFEFKFDKALDIIPRAAIEKKPYIIKRATEDHRCSQAFVELVSLKEYVVVPLIARDIAVGVLLADNNINERSIEETDLEPLTLFANQVALAMENAKLYEKVEQLAIMDGLTNIYNHRYFQDALKTELSRLERYYQIPTEKLSVIMMDVDFFKRYNDTNGHPAGDAVLVEIGQILKELTRKVDIVARYGGEEFILLVPSTPKSGAIILAERIRKTVEEHPFEFGMNQPDGKLTISIGVATYEEDGRNPKELIEMADKALYQAKTTGKNKVCYINPPKNLEEMVSDTVKLVEGEKRTSDK